MLIPWAYSFGKQIFLCTMKAPSITFLVLVRLIFHNIIVEFCIYLDEKRNLVLQDDVTTFMFIKHILLISSFFTIVKSVNWHQFKIGFDNCLFLFNRLEEIDSFGNSQLINFTLHLTIVLTNVTLLTWLELKFKNILHPKQKQHKSPKWWLQIKHLALK